MSRREQYNKMESGHKKELEDLPKQHQEEKENFINLDQQEAAGINKLIDIGFSPEKADELEKIVTSVVRLDRYEPRDYDHPYNTLRKLISDCKFGEKNNPKVDVDDLNTFGFINLKEIHNPIHEDILILNFSKILGEARKRSTAMFGTGSGREEKALKNKIKSLDDLLAEMKRLGVRPVNLMEFLALASTEEMKDSPMVELGDILTNKESQVFLAVTQKGATVLTGGIIPKNLVAINIKDEESFYRFLLYFNFPVVREQSKQL